MVRVASVAALGLGLAALSASPALALASEPIVVHVPFAFNVGDKTLPPGDYRVSQMAGIDPQVVEIRSTDGRSAALALTVDRRPVDRNAQPDLVFDKYGTREFLHAIRLPELSGAVLEPSPNEVQAARDLATHKVAKAAAR